MRHIIVASLVLAAAGSAQAGYSSLFDMQVDFNGQAWVMSQYPNDWSSRVNENGDTVIHGQSVCFQDASGNWMGMTYDLIIGSTDNTRGNPISSISSSFTLTNAFPVTNTFTVTASLPITIPFPTTLMRGSFSGSVIDNSAGQNGATIAAVAGGSMYEALLDGGTVRTLRNDPFSVSAAGGSTASIPTQNFGVPAFEAGPAAAATIGIRNTFTLTADDSATNSSTFIIQVPAPGFAGVAGLAGLVGLRRRR